MEFFASDRVIVNPLRIKDWIVDELESSMVLYFTGTSRKSAEIIDEQARHVQQKNRCSVEAMHRLKTDALAMKEALLKGNLQTFAKFMAQSWEAKKNMAHSITNEEIEQVYQKAQNAGALAGKITGAGGGGFMMLIVESTRKLHVIEHLNRSSGKVFNFHFTKRGVVGWKIID